MMNAFSQYIGRILLVGIALIFCSCNRNQDTPLNQWNDFIEVRKGTIPLLLVAAHGGDLKPQWIADRACSGAVVTQDQYTLGIALQIEQELNRMGFQPYMILAKIHRVKVDLNRSLVTSHCDDDTSNELWELFHSQIAAFREEVIQKHQRGLLIDIHGHGHPIQRIELGYLLTSDQLREIADNATSIDDAATSIRSLLNNHPVGISLNEVIVGENSLGTRLEENGFPTVPSANDPAPNQNDPFFSGGTNTKLYGSKSSVGVDAIQLELNRHGLRSESDDRSRFARVFAETIIEFMEYHYADVFSP